MSSSPLILEVKGNSLDDGPGIRTVVFFKGCPLSCLWCHNPEGQSTKTELGFDGRGCIGCAACERACGQGAIQLGQRGRVARGACVACFECESVCPTGSLQRLGRSMDVEFLADLVCRDLPFFESSGGGVTLSGGEPALFPEYAGRLAKACRKRGAHVLLETSGLFDLQRFEEQLLPSLDLVYFDLKLARDDEHRRFCGVSNDSILENFRALHERSLIEGPKVLPRVPLIPGVTATQENLIAIARLLSDVGADEVALLPYNPLWPAKHAALGRADPLEDARVRDLPHLDRWMTEEELALCRAIFDAFSVR